MAKKQRRKQTQKQVRQPVESTAPGQPGLSARPAPVPSARAAAASRTQKPADTWAEHAQRYQYVTSELKTLGIIAGSFLVVLLILAAIIG